MKKILNFLFRKNAKNKALHRAGGEMDRIVHKQTGDAIRVWSSEVPYVSPTIGVERPDFQKIYKPANYFFRMFVVKTTENCMDGSLKRKLNGYAALVSLHRFN